MKPSFDDEMFNDWVEDVMCMVEEIHLRKGLDMDGTWMEDTENKWFGKDSPDCLIGKCDSWKELKKKLCEHYELEMSDDEDEDE